MSASMKRFCFAVLPILLCACEPKAIDALRSNAIVYCSAAQPSSFDPQTATSGATFDATSRLLFDRLVNLSPDGDTIIPSLAKSWRLSNNKLRYEFELRGNVQFHRTDYFKPSRPLTADDVIFSLRRQFGDEYFASSQFRYFNSLGLARVIRSIEKVSPLKVRITLNKPNPMFLKILAMDFASIHSKEYFAQLVRQGNPEQLHYLPVGTGPFKYSYYRRGIFIGYQRHHEYWRGPANVERFAIAISQDPSLRFAKLAAGECDIIRDPLAQQLKSVNQIPHLKTARHAGLNIAYLSFNTQHPLLKDRQIRSYIASLVDKEKIVQSVYSGQAETAESLFPHRILRRTPSSEPTKIADYTRSESFQLNSSDKIEIWTTNAQRPYNPAPLKMAELIQQDLEAAGIKSRIRSFELNTYLKKLKQTEYAIAILGWIADIPDPDNFYSPLVSCDGIRGGNNFSFWCNREADSLLADARKTRNVNARTKIYEKVDKLIAAHSPILPIAHSLQHIIYNRRVKNLSFDATGNINFYTLRLDMSE